MPFGHAAAHHHRCVGHPPPVAELPLEVECLSGVPKGGIRVSQVKRHDACAVEEARPRWPWPSDGREHPVQAAFAFCRSARGCRKQLIPPSAEGVLRLGLLPADRRRHAGCRGRPSAGRAIFVVFHRALVELLRKGSEVLRVTARDFVGLAEASSRSTANSRMVSSIQKRRSPHADKALVDQRLEDVEVGVADRLGSLERAAAEEDGQAREERAAPRRRAARGSTRSSPAASAGAGRRRGRRRSRSRRCAEPLEQLLGRETLDARRGQLERERQIVEARAELARPSRSARTGLDRARSRRKSSTAPRSASGATAYSCSPPRCSGSRLVTSSVRFGQRSSSARELAAPPSSRCSKLSSSEQQPLVADVVGERRPSRRAPAPPSRRTSAGSRSARERHPPHAVREVVRYRAAACNARRVLPVRPAR